MIDGWDFAATYEAARQVGGDFYDFLNLGDDARRMGLVIADVTGKGVPAALMMAYSRAVLRAQSMAGQLAGRGARQHQSTDDAWSARRVHS